MIVLDWPGTSRYEAGVAAVFGVGLIGSALTRALEREVGARKRQFDWNWATDGADNSPLVERAVLDALDTHSGAKLAVVWAAGVGGFGASSSWMAKEVGSLEAVISLARRLGRKVPESGLSFHLVSSAGGLFEGQVACGRDTRPHPLCPYGHSKLEQERLVTGGDGLGCRRIYRPSSVYGYAPGGRRGLIPVLIAAAKQSRTAQIIGSLTTQRDYILAADVGRFIATSVLKPGSAPVETALLASGRPTAICEIIHLIEASVGAPLFLKVDPNPANARDNTFLPSALPRGFQPTTLTEGIARTASAVTLDILLKPAA